ncbi:MAG: MoxR family ATPase [Butyrivibrio sp.]|nr:MoxR family ATPase [Butyrivibrio sp.]
MSKIEDIRDNIGKVIVGKDETVLLAVVAMIAGGHVLLEDVPGTGKTVLARAIAKSVEGSFNRIQFTPDLLPSDITGLSVYQEATSEFVFKKGPVFCNVLLADEINRATPRTQAGLLECMEERQVTVDGETRVLAEPFFVIATQNPVETSGTFPLPEAQLDRFMMKLSMGLPEKEQEVEILRRFQGRKREDKLKDIETIVSFDDIKKMQEDARNVEVHPQLREYIADIVVATRNRDDVASGVSPRGSLALLSCAQVLAMAMGRNYVTPEDIRRLAVPVLAHRLIMSGGYGKTGDSKQVIESILEEVKVPTEEAFNK